MAPGRASAAAPRTATADREFVQQAAESGQAEIAAARLALLNAGKDEVRRFARRLIDDHTEADARLRQFAAAGQIRVPNDASAMQQSKLALLRATKAERFDHEFLQVFGVQAHQDAISLFERAQSQGRNEPLKRFAADTLPALRAHLDMARQLLGDAQAAGSAPGVAAASAGPDSRQALNDAQQLVQDAVQTVQTMKRDPRVASALDQAHGVFILPHYGRGALGVGAQGGEGVMVARQGDEFGDPLFCNMGGLSVGVQAGGSGGPVALLLMSAAAVRDFGSGKTLSLNADAAVTVADWSRRTQASGGKVQDVVVWSGTQGAFAGASVGVTSVSFDEEANDAYYGRDSVEPDQVIRGRIENPHHNVLGQVLDI
jgi:lipid-binding SYLF domain-containing protein/predicted outer membrane protein